MKRKRIGRGVLYNADCFEVFERIPDKMVDMVLCDLPYGTTSNKWDSVLPFDELWQHYDRICKDNAIIALTASQPFSSALVMSNTKMFKHEWVWLKNRGSNFANTVREPMKEHEVVLIFSKGKWTYNRQMQERSGGGLARSKYAVKYNSKSDNYRAFDGRIKQEQSALRVPSSCQQFNVEVGLHPTQKPVKLFEYLIKTYTNEGEWVLDNCSGSGTTAIAAENLRRKWICIEKEEKYASESLRRIREHCERRGGILSEYMS